MKTATMYYKPSDGLPTTEEVSAAFATLSTTGKVEPPPADDEHFVEPPSTWLIDPEYGCVYLHLDTDLPYSEEAIKVEGFDVLLFVEPIKEEIQDR
jgi:hypothetical protein